MAQHLTPLPAQPTPLIGREADLAVEFGLDRGEATPCARPDAARLI